MKRLVLIIAAGIAAFSCKSGDEAAKVVAERVEQVSTTVLVPTQVNRTVKFSTVLEGYQRRNVAPGIQGIIQKINVEVGDRVKQGADLVLMDEQQYNATALQYSNLCIEFGRMEELRKEGVVSQQAYDQTKLALDQTKTSLDYLKRNTYVKADFDAVVSARNYEPGELYAGQPVVVLTQINKLKALIAVPETFFPNVKKGMKVNIQSDIYPGKLFPATVEIIYPTINAQSHTFQVQLLIPNANEILRPGMYVHTEVAMGQTTAIVAPYQAVLKLTGSNDRYVFVNEGGVAKRVGVTLGERFDDKVEIISDEITEGTELVVLGQTRLVDGVKLNVVNK